MFFAARTDAGLVRATNQDRCLALTLAVADCQVSRSVGFYAVADGVGGGSAGDRASSTALSVTYDHLLRVLSARDEANEDRLRDVHGLLNSAIQAANKQVFNDATGDPGLAGMGTTLTAGLVSQGSLHIAQIGDSRCYRLRGDSFQQLSSDQSLVAELVRLGRITAHQARTHPHRNVITRAIGIQETVEVEITSHTVEEGDLYLFCSDGLWGMIEDGDIRGVLLDLDAQKPDLSRGHALEVAADRLVKDALIAGGDDNVTVLLAAIERQDVHPEALIDDASLARTRLEGDAPETTDLKKTLRYRLNRGIGEERV